MMTDDTHNNYISDAKNMVRLRVVFPCGGQLPRGIKYSTPTTDPQALSRPETMAICVSSHAGTGQQPEHANPQWNCINACPTRGDHRKRVRVWDEINNTPHGWVLRCTGRVEYAEEASNGQ